MPKTRLVTVSSVLRIIVPGEKYLTATPKGAAYVMMTGLRSPHSEDVEVEEALLERCLQLIDQAETIRNLTNYHWWPQTA